LSLICLEYTTYDLIVDKKQQTWIFDSAECQVVVFDPNLSVLQKYKGICFDACGFDTTTVLTINQSLDRVFWFKGDGVLSEFNIETLDEKVNCFFFVFNVRFTGKKSRPVLMCGK
jgi:hypothetical protein